MKVCSYCERRQGEPGTARSDTFCPRCEFCFRFVEEAKKSGFGFRGWLDENREGVDGLVDDVKKEMKNFVRWEGKDGREPEIDQEVKRLFVEQVIRRASSELQAESKEKTPPDRR